MKVFKRSSRSGFALLITLGLLALLVLTVLTLSSLVRISGQISSAATYQVQARQNALLGLNVGLSELQRHAGDDTRITGMAGIAGIAPLAANSTRHWCGVWENSGAFVAWLTSGAPNSAVATPPPAANSIELVADGSVGAKAADSEHVVAGKIAITVTEMPNSPGVSATIGSYAYAVLDEGVKIPANAPGSVLGVAPVVFSTSATSAQGKLRDAIAANTANLPKTFCYEQLSLLPTPATALTPSILQDNLHHTTLTSRFVNGGNLQTGKVNVNTNSAKVWRSVLQTYNLQLAAPVQIASGTVSSKGTTIQNTIAGSVVSGKAVNGPFTSVAAFSTYLATVFPASGSPTAAQIMAVITPMLAVRSDTFRIRGYGDALNPVDPTKIESIANCEAIVQRTTAPAANGQGNKFVVLYFRWLGADDI